MTELNKFQQEIESLLQKADKATDRRLCDLYIDTIKDLKKSLLVDYQRLDSLTSSQRLKLSQMSALLEQLDQSAEKLKKGLRSEITGHLIDTGKIAYNELFYEFESGHGGINFAMLKEDELRAVIETPVANFKLSERLNDGVVERLRNNIKDDLNRIFLHGASYAQASARLAEQGYSSYRRAMMITRTEAGRVQAVAREKAQAEAKELGIEFDKVWVATLDGRTRHNHAELDGAKADEDGYFEINGLRTKQPHMFGFASEDVNCRCRTISRLKDDDTPLLRRDNETGEVVEYRNYREWERAKTNKVTVEKNKDEEYNYIKGEDNIQKAIADFGKISDEQADLIYEERRGDGGGYIKTGNSFDINRALRPGGDMDILTDDDWDVMAALDEVIESNATPYNIRGLRKVSYDYLDSFLANTDVPKGTSLSELAENINNLNNHAYFELAYSSVSVDPDKNVFENRRIWLDIEVPKGTNAYMSSNLMESEFILGTGTTFELKGSSVAQDKYGDLLKITLRVKEK
ncbi:phage minor head protein [Streptococcus suis]|uniref:phage minor head protein n=1 Tax=Streptococcus suis TaxID=1307 RepID=UPI00201A2E7C|nr:phage minor head protein [Streptococcus suis]MCL4882646.1 phage minor head protein [Streptococcus suis]